MQIPRQEITWLALFISDPGNSLKKNPFKR